jgi:hypothetical protein
LFDVRQHNTIDVDGIRFGNILLAYTEGITMKKEGINKS